MIDDEVNLNKSEYKGRTKSFVRSALIWLTAIIWPFFTGYLVLGAYSNHMSFITPWADIPFVIVPGFLFLLLLKGTKKEKALYAVLLFFIVADIFLASHLLFPPEPLYNIR